MGSARTHGEALVADGGDKGREEAEMALAAMAEDKCSAGEMITAAAGQMSGQDAINSIQKQLADNWFSVWLRRKLDSQSLVYARQ